MDTCIITLRFANGALGVIDNSRQAVYGYDQRIEVFGSKGCITADNETAEQHHPLHRRRRQRSEKPLWFFLERYNDAFIQPRRTLLCGRLPERQTHRCGRVRRPAAREASPSRPRRACELGGVPVKVE